MRRLYLQIYATLVGILILFMAAASALWWLHARDPDAALGRERVAAFADAVLPASLTDDAEQQRRIDALAAALRASISVFGPDGRTLAAAGRPLTLPEPDEAGRFGGFRRRGAMALTLADGRIVVVEADDVAGDHELLAFVLLLALVTAIGAWPVVRRLTRRLESLQREVEALGEGDLTARVPIEGRDEVADLARTFNRTAERIEQLVADKRRALATTSHELRTPLARIRVAAELLGDDARPELRRQIETDIRELDALIGELLVASRLDSPELDIEREPVDLLALAVEMAAPYAADVEGAPVLVRGDRRLLARMLRNLLENARRHGGGGTALAVGAAVDGGVRLAVSDDGPGVPADERERIFEPFYRPRPREGGSPPEVTLGEGGLGLALVRQIVERHDGRVRCEAREGGGTRFEVWLPAA